MSIEDDPTSMADFGFAGTFEYDLGTTMIDAPGEFPDPAPLDQKAVVYFPADAAGVSIFTAVQQQLGLKLEARTNAADRLVVVRAELPSSN